MGLSGFLRVGVWKNGYRAFKNGFLGGNVYGEGFVMGGVFVIGPGSQVGPCDISSSNSLILFDLPHHHLLRPALIHTHSQSFSPSKTQIR